MDRLASMAAFVKTVERGSFAGAATALMISPQMVAKHIGYLEHRLGARLLNRTTRRQSLTEIGRTYYERCRVVLAEAEWAEAAGDGAKGAPRGRLRINAPVSFGSQALTPVVSRYLLAQPQVQVELVLSDRYVDLVEDGFEAVFRIGRIRESSLTAHALRPFRLVACASPAYVAENGFPAEPDDLKTHRCLGYLAGRGLLSEWRFDRKGQQISVSIASQFQVNNAAALLSAALDGFGVTLIAEDLARCALADGRLIRVLPEYNPPSRSTTLLVHSDRRHTTKLQSFIDAVLKTLGPEADV